MVLNTLLIIRSRECKRKQQDFALRPNNLLNLLKLFET